MEVYVPHAFVRLGGERDKTPDIWRFDMMGIRKRALFIAITGLVSAGLISFGCSSSNSTTTGSGGSAGTSAGGGSAGTRTSAGGGTAGTGTAGASSQDAGNACTGKTDVAPTDGVIDKFTAVGDAGATPSGIPGGYTTYSDPTPGAAPTVTYVNGAAHVVENAAATASPQYVGFVLYFTDCVNASAFTGIEFTISGTMTGCTLQLSANYSENDNKASDPAKGSCSMPPAADCYSNQKAVTGITTTPTTVQVPWSGFAGGVPAGPTDSTQLTGVQWQLTIPAGTGTCAAELSITDVKFYQ